MRILGIFPAYNVSDAKNRQPLSDKDKWKLSIIGTVNPWAIIGTATSAGFAQALDSYPGFGQGGEGYAKRFGAGMADRASRQLFARFLLPVTLNQDPRYVRLGEGSFKSRLGYALASTFVAYRDSRGRTFNTSNVLGTFMSGALSNAYYPESTGGVGFTFSHSAVTLGQGALGSIVTEFWPDISQHFQRKKNPPRLPPAAPTTPSDSANTANP